MNKKLLFRLTFLFIAGNFLFCPAAYAQARYPKQTKEFSLPFIEASKTAIPAVVFIKAESKQERYPRGRGGQQDPFDFFSDEFFNRFFGGPPSRDMEPMPQLSQGSGFFVSDDGFILTNYHVVHNAQHVDVILQNGNSKIYTAEIIGGDPRTDIALLKIDPDKGQKFPYLQLGDSEDVEIGEWVIAVGNPFELEATVTAGLISAKGRQNLQINDLEDFIQTDAAINPGNSGGPLINLEGKVIGINTAIVSRSGGYMGIGFAVPSNIAKNVQEQLMENGRVTRGFLGVSLQEIDHDLAESFNLENSQGALVAEVVKDSPADKAGIKQGDIIIGFNDTPVKSPGQLRNQVMLLQPGTKITLDLIRNGKKKTVHVTLGKHSGDAETLATTTHELGFAIKSLTPELQEKYHIRPGEQGVIIVDVKPGSLAAKNGLRPGFLIMGVNHKKITSLEEFNQAMEAAKNSKRVLLLVKHGDMMRFHSFKLS